MHINFLIALKVIINLQQTEVFFLLLQNREKETSSLFTISVEYLHEKSSRYPHNETHIRFDEIHKHIVSLTLNREEHRILLPSALNEVAAHTTHQSLILSSSKNFCVRHQKRVNTEFDSCLLRGCIETRLFPTLYLIPEVQIV